VEWSEDFERVAEGRLRASNGQFPFTSALPESRLLLAYLQRERGRVIDIAVP
jgi:hypothetical protein